MARFLAQLALKFIVGLMAHEFAALFNPRRLLARLITAYLALGNLTLRLFQKWLQRPHGRNAAFVRLGIEPKDVTCLLYTSDAADE